MRHLKLSRAFTLIEPGPVVLVTTRDEGKNNVMTISWTMVLDFTPMFAIATGGVGPVGLAAVGAHFGGGMAAGATALAFGGSAATVAAASATTLVYMPAQERPPRKDKSWSIEHQIACQIEDMDNRTRFKKLLVEDMETMWNRGRG